MVSHTRRMFGLAAAFVLVAGAVEAQGQGHEKGKVQTKARGAQTLGDRDAQGRVIIRDDRDRAVYRDGRKVPPGLAKKPGGMPPGQYKKRYSTTEGSSVLRDILRGRGYTVIRTESARDRQYVFYRLRDGSVRRAVVTHGEDRLHFGNLPQAIAREVLIRLY